MLEQEATHQNIFTAPNLAIILNQMLMEVVICFDSPLICLQIYTKVLIAFTKFKEKFEGTVKTNYHFHQHFTQIQMEVPAALTLFERGRLATPFNPATWIHRSRSQRMFE